MNEKYCEDCDIIFSQSDGCPSCDNGDCIDAEEYYNRFSDPAKLIPIKKEMPGPHFLTIGGAKISFYCYTCKTFFDADTMPDKCPNCPTNENGEGI